MKDWHAELEKARKIYKENKKPTMREQLISLAWLVGQIVAFIVAGYLCCKWWLV